MVLMENFNRDISNVLRANLMDILKSNYFITRLSYKFQLE